MKLLNNFWVCKIEWFDHFGGFHHDPMLARDRRGGGKKWRAKEDTEIPVLNAGFHRFRSKWSSFLPEPRRRRPIKTYGSGFRSQIETTIRFSLCLLFTIGWSDRRGSRITQALKGNSSYCKHTTCLLPAKASSGISHLSRRCSYEKVPCLDVDTLKFDLNGRFCIVLKTD